MKERSYRVILDGTILDGFHRDQVIERLSAAFKKDERFVERLLAAAPKPIRGGMALAEARKYESILAKLGAGTRIVEEEPLSAVPKPEPPRSEKPAMPPAVPGPTKRQEQEAGEPEPPVYSSEIRRLRKKTAQHATGEAKTPLQGETVACPKCGYTAKLPDDVLIVRGDCPRCGLRVRKDSINDEAYDEDQEVAYLRRKMRPESIYRDRSPASSERRMVAALCTFGLFLLTHAALALFLVFMLVPLESLLSHAGTVFYELVFLDFPELLVCGALIMVSCVFPLFNRGLSLGQSVAEIEVLYTEESRMGGLYMALATRTAAAMILTLAPGWTILWLGSWVGWFSSHWAVAAVVVVSGSCGWVGACLYAWTRPDSRSLLDLAAGTIQVEDMPMPVDASRKAGIWFLAGAGAWVLLGGIIPLIAWLAS